jgi:hypothetical protein
MKEQTVATKKAAEVKEQTKIQRVEIADAVDDSLGEDDLWNDIITENPVPDLVVKGVRIKQPTKEQIDEWSKAVARNDTDPEKLLMPEEDYELLKHAFDKLPLSAWRNFQNRFTNHIFGLDQETLGK